MISENDEIIALRWGTGGADQSDFLQEAGRQVKDYFKGRRTRFDLPIRVTGSDFQKAVCTALCAIPFGQTRRYGDIAKDLGAPAQAVGQACGANPVPILIPCHRVLGARGLGGFSGGTGIETKAALLRHEGAMLL